MTDRCGPGQALANAIIELEELLSRRGCSVTIRWTPAHKGVEGNEVADSCAKWVDRAYVREASIAYLSCKTTGTRSQRTKEWIQIHVRGSRRYRPPCNESE